MATPPLISFEDLLKPISDEEPAGSSVPFTLRQDLEEMRKEINPEDFDDDDPTKPEQPKYAEWDKIVEVTQKTLRETSKDLLVAARLTEALTKLHGFAGVRDGLHLMRQMVGDCWDRIYPDIDDGDLEVRAGPFNWLDDRDRGARFPTTIHMLPLFPQSGQSFSWLNWKQIQEGKEGLTSQDFEEVVAQASLEECQTLTEDLDGSVEELSQVKEILQEKLGADAPGLQELQNALAECSILAKQILQHKSPVEEEGGDSSSDENGKAGQGGGAPARKMRTREDIFQQLKEAATLLQRMEPHSPIPYLIFKAVEWGKLPFPQLMREMVRDDSVINQMNRELGIKEESDY